MTTRGNAANASSRNRKREDAHVVANIPIVHLRRNYMVPAPKFIPKMNDRLGFQ